MIYLDHAATTHPHEDAIAAMDPYLEAHIHNPSAQYVTEAAEGIKRARSQLAQLIGADSGSIAFTGGGSEADNLALKGIFDNVDTGHLVTSTIEHAAIENAARWLERQGIDVARVAPQEDGRVDPMAVREAIRPETKLVSIMHANNETGVVQPIEEIASIARKRDVLVHSDTVQSAGKLPLGVEEMGLYMASLSAHKFYGPKGVGALYVNEDLRPELEPLIHGGGQEGGLRSGTENVPGIVGMGVAAERARESRKERAQRLSELREELIDRVHNRTDGQRIGHPGQRLPGYALFCFEDVAGTDVVEALAERGIAVSSGSACHSDTPSPSTVLTEMGIDAETALGAVRFSMGRDTDLEDVVKAVNALEDALTTIRT